MCIRDREKYGSDKPDTRFGMLIQDITAVSYTHLAGTHIKRN